MYWLVVVSVVVLVKDVWSCPAECTCSTDHLYPDGVLVDCENLGLDQLPFDIPSHVSTLLLNFNNMRSMEGLQYYNNLRALELQHNYLRGIDASVIQMLPYLKILVLSENEIESVEEQVFRGLTHLEWLDLRGNAISYISEEAFYKAGNINYLNVVGNKLTDIAAGTLLPLQNHNIWLMLGNNSLTEIPRDVTSMSGIQYLSVAYNQIQFIPPQTFNKNLNLRTLDISHNQLSYLHAGTFDTLSLIKLSGTGNPWQCDCYTEWLRQYLQVRQVQHDIVCTAPPHVRGARLSSLARALECLEPVIAAPDPVLSVLEHKNTTLTCLVSGESSSSVSWFKDGRALSPQANRYTKGSGRERKLVFRSVMYTDGGHYVCRVASGQNSSIDLSVLYAPKIVNSYKWTPTGRGELDVSLACDVLANPSLNGPITWLHENREVYGSERGVRISRTGAGSVLHLSNAPDADNSGDYQCQAANSLGSAEEHFQVTHSDILMIRSSTMRAAPISLLLFTVLVVWHAYC